MTGAGDPNGGAGWWRALDELVEQPAMRARLAEAFPSLARSADDWRRRDILKCLGGAMAIAGLDACERIPDEEALPMVTGGDGGAPGAARFYASAVELDGVAQPVIGKTVDGRPIKLEGNPDHPASAGATDAFTQAALLGLYDPGRSASPMARGRPTSWEHFDRATADLQERLDRTDGAGFRLLTGLVGSPTLLRQTGDLLARWPEARWHVWSPVPGAGDETRLRLDRAEAVVALDDDLLGPGPRQLWHARGWSLRRRAYQRGEGDAALFVAEPSPTITGVTATRRLAAGEARIAPLLVALGRLCGVDGLPDMPLTSPERDWVDEAGAALRRHPGAGLVALGAHHPPNLHRLARAIDERMGNPGRTRLSAGPRARGSTSMDELTAEMRAGQVSTLMLLETNPAYSAPGFAALMARVPMRLHAGLHRDETALLSHWHVPLSHALESWSDGIAADGTPTLTQPLVRPWLPVRSRHALLAGLLGDGKSDRERIAATWDLEGEAWERALVRGMPGRAPAAARTEARKDAAPPHAGPPLLPERDDASSDLSLIIRPDPSIWDGQFAGNPWMQETPKPLTKICWGNAVHISPALARARGLDNGDRVRLSRGGRGVAGPVWIVPGQDRRTILIHCGHGRRAGGKVAEGVGFDATPLAGATGKVRLERIDGRERIASTQHHFAMEADEYVRFVEKAGEKLKTEPPPANFYPPQKSSPAWGMAIDLDLCIGCNACLVACVAENNIPMVGREQVAMGREMHWLRVDRYYQGSPDDPRHAFQPVPCMHCENAPCEMGCPVNAAVHSPDGLNLQVYNRCIGTRTCSAYCPYKVRRFNWFDLTGDDPPELKAVRNPDVTVRSRGVMEKCTYCIQRIEGARIQAKKEDRPIREGEVVTACQAACPTDAIVFGDISKPESAVTARKGNGRDYDLLPEANTRPRTSYQARIRGGEKA